MQEGISVADLDADSLNESAENTQEDQIQNDQLEDAQLDDTLAPEHYDASDLRVLEGLEAVRIRPGMYIGSTGPRGLHHLVYEIVDNSVDEALAGYASHIEVTILPDGGVRVVDDGRGIPVDEVPGEGVSGVETVMTKLHAGGKFGGGGYAVSGGLHGVGISVVNALSTRVDIEVRRQGFHWTQTYIDQKPTARLAKGEPMGEDESTGTSVTFWADGAIFETTTYDFETLRNRFQQMAFLNKGLKLSLTDLREPDQAGDEVAGESDDNAEPKHQTVTYQYNDGIKDYVDYLVKSRKATPVEPDVIDFEAEDLKIGISAEIAMQWTTAYSEAVHTFVRRQMWGYETGEPPAPKQVVRGEYRGRRMAFGYPASPDHSLKREVFDLLAVEVTTGMRLTENWMIDPGEALCGLMFSDADYFSVGTIGAEQLLDYARRRGMEAETVKKIIPNNV